MPINITITGGTMTASLSQQRRRRLQLNRGIATLNVELWLSKKDNPDGITIKAADIDVDLDGCEPDSEREADAIIDAVMERLQGILDARHKVITVEDTW